MTNPARPHAEPRSAYKAFCPISTRWSDNIVYGHVNNVVYYNWFDTAVNGLPTAQGAIEIHSGSVIGLAVETQSIILRRWRFPRLWWRAFGWRMLGRPAWFARSLSDLGRRKRKSAPARIVFSDFAGQYRYIGQKSGEK